MLGINHSSRSARRRSTRREARLQPPAPRSVEAPVTSRHSDSRYSNLRHRPEGISSQRSEQLRSLAQRTKPDRVVPPERLSRRRHQDAAASPRFSLRHLFSPRLSSPRPTAPTSSKPLPAPRPLRVAKRSVPLALRDAQIPNAARSVRAIAPTELRRRTTPVDRRFDSERLHPSIAPAPPKSRRRRRSASPLLHVFRLLILGVGIGAIAGTLLSVLNPESRQGEVAQAVRSMAAGSTAEQANAVDTSQVNAMTPVTLQLGEKLPALTTTIQKLTAQASGLTPGVFLVDIDTGAYLDLNGSSIFAAASMIKVPVLVALLQEVDAGKIRLDESLTMKAADIATGSGDIQYQPVGTRYTVLETAVEMIVASDNTATNMLIARLGGAAVLNQRFQDWGLTSTAIRQLLPDLQGTNTTTPRELAELLSSVNQGELLSLRSRDRMFDIMRHTITNTLLPAGLSPEATIAHKTGDIGSMVGDTGVIDAANGKRYVMTVMVQRPHNDSRAQDLIRQISRATYEYLNQPTSPTLSAEAKPENAPQSGTNAPP